jgi:hypothetical protein
MEDSTMPTNHIDDDVLYSPPDDGSGENIPDIYNPELLAKELPTTKHRIMFMSAALSAYQYLGYDTPPARRRIQELFEAYKNDLK